MTQLVLTPAQVAAPQNTLAPSISGAAQVRQALTGNPGTWTGGPLLGVQWLRGGQVISGATGLTYVLQEADLGALVALRITASNAGGTQVATSAAVWPVTALPANSADTFDTATSVSVLSYVGESGQVWTQRGGDSVTPASVAGGVCVAVEHAAARVVSRGPVLDPDQFAQATFVRGGAANSSVALAVRVSDAGSAYWFRFNGALAEWQLFRSNATSATLMGSFAGSVAGWAGPEDTALVRLEAQGATLRALVNGTPLITRTDTTHTAGRIGIRVFRLGDPGQRLADFAGGSLVPVPPEPEPPPPAPEQTAGWTVSIRDHGAAVLDSPTFAGAWSVTSTDSGATLNSHPESP